MARRHPRSLKRQTNLESDLATEFDAVVLHNKVYEAVGADDELAQYCDALAAAEDARDIHDGPDGRSERYESMDAACERFETASRTRARDVAGEACATIIDEADDWTDVWDEADIEEAQQEAREWLSDHPRVASRLDLSVCETWQCEECGDIQAGEPAHRDQHPGADLWFCEGCTR